MSDAHRATYSAVSANDVATRWTRHAAAAVGVRTAPRSTKGAGGSKKPSSSTDQPGGAASEVGALLDVGLVR